MSEKKEREHNLGTEFRYDLTVDFNLVPSLRPVWAIVAKFWPQKFPFWTTLGAHGGHSAQYLAHVGYSVVLCR